jgi:integrase/recombinase XerD
MTKAKSGPWEGIVRDYEVQLRADGKSSGTISTYLQAVRQFTDFHKDANSTNAITQNSVNNWLTQFNPRKGTLNLKKIALRKFLGFIKSERGFKKDIKITVKDISRPEPSYLTIPEQQLLLQFTKGLGETSQYFVMLKLMLYSGLRISEATNLKFSDVEDSTLVLRQTKNGSVRRKHLKNEIAKMLKIYINARRNKYPLNEAPSGSEDYLFSTLYKGIYKSYTRQGVNKIVKKLAKQVGITKRISCHTLRHSFAVRFLNRGGSLIGLKNYLGHKDIKTTSIYTHVSDEQLKEELERL